MLLFSLKDQSKLLDLFIKEEMVFICFDKPMK
jgi:hypothetical protein